MTHKFIDYFHKISPLTSEESKGIEESMRVETFKKGTLLLREGQISIDTYFILKGCIREYLIVDAEEKTTNFFTEDQWVISLNNFGPATSNRHYLSCEEDTSVCSGNEKEAQEIFKRFPRFETISRAVMEDYFATQRKLMTSYLTDSPEQRYLNLLKTRPDLFQRIPQYQLASYIGVKPESLSRIRKRIISNS